MFQLYLFLESNTPAALKRLIPESWRTWLGYQIKVRRNRGFGYAERLKRPLRLPDGETEKSLFDYLAQYRQEGQEESEELRGYLREAFRRFLYTLQIVPPGQGNLLEVGAGPYFISLLLRRFTGYSLTYTNYFGPAFGSGGADTMIGAEERVRFDFHNVNVEETPLPFGEDAFDVVLLCEVLEHFTNDPVQALTYIKQVLKPGGTLILTTPNVNRLINVARMIAGQNIYDPYSGYGPYGRHNREYTCAELRELLAYVGFVVEEMFTSDVHANETQFYVNPHVIVPFVKQRADTLGQYIFVRARNAGPAGSKRPRWLYRSYPENRLA